MKRRTRRFALRSLSAAVASSAAVVAVASPALAIDSFGVETAISGPNGCPFAASGHASFVDNGPGAPGGGNNDDYIVIDDTCSDGWSVAAYAW
jgi:hypothetical protein